MNRPLLALFASLLVGTGLAGCMGGDSSKLGLDDDATVLTGKARVMDVLQKLPYTPGYRGSEALPWFENFVFTYNKREWGTPMAAAAAEFLVKELKRIGFESDLLVYKMKYPGTAGLGIDGDFRVVRGVKMGVGNSSHRLALVSHYDVHTGTTEGAYDNGAGLVVQFEACKLLARVPTNKTIECLFFDGEEKGLLGSQAYVEDYLRGKKEYTYDMAFGFDMTGLNYPGYDKWKFYAFAGMTAKDKNFTGLMQEANMAFLNTTMYDFLQPRQNVKPSGVEVRMGNTRRSDERRFEEVLGVPVIRFAGGERPTDYLMYHRPGDTAEFLYAYACDYCASFQYQGRAIFAKGMEFAAIVSYYTIMAYDQFDPFQIPLSEKDQPSILSAKT